MRCRKGGLASALALGLAVLGAGPAQAEFQMLAFRSPTGNIHCGLVTQGSENFAICEIRELTQSYTQRPLDCDLDWGASFSVGERGRGTLPCHGDTVQSAESLVLSYGKTVELFGIRCTSEKTGMTCRNGEGGGFMVGRARQRVF